MDEQAILIFTLRRRKYLQAARLRGGLQTVAQPFPLTVDLTQLFA